MKKTIAFIVMLAVALTVLHESAFAQRFDRARRARTNSQVTVPMKIEKAEFGKTADDV